MRGLLLSGVLVSIGLFFGRMAGFVREAFIASSFGASEQTDLIIVFLSTPDVLVNLLIGGALSMALIPEFKQLTRIQAINLYQQVFMLLMITFFILAVIGYIFSSEMLTLFAPGLSDIAKDQYSSFFGITFIAIPLTVAAGVTTALLNYQGKYLIPALGTLIFNSVIILGLYVASKYEHIHLLLIISISVGIGALIRWLTQVVNSKVLPFTKVNFSDNLIRAELIKRYIYCVLTGGLIFLIPVISRSIASLSGAGELSLINYALKLVDFPLGVVLTVFGIVFFPKLSEYYAECKEKKFESICKKLLLIVLTISIAMFISLHYFANAIVNVVYGWGQLNIEQIAKVTKYFQIASITLPFQAINALLISILASRKDALKPLFFSSVLVLSYILFGFGMVSSMDELFFMMIITYSLLSLSLFFVLAKFHKIMFFTVDVNIELFKLAFLSVILYLSLLYFDVGFLNKWLDLFMAFLVCGSFLIVCSVLNFEFRQLFLFRIKKG